MRAVSRLAAALEGKDRTPLDSLSKIVSSVLSTSILSLLAWKDDRYISLLKSSCLETPRQVVLDNPNTSG